MRRHKMTRKGSKKSFRRYSGTKSKNVAAAPMRGGWRI